MSYVYIKSEPGLYTVGFYDPNGKWQAESDHGDSEEAAKRVSWLNGGQKSAGIKVVNAIDPKAFTALIASPEGEKAIVKIITDNINDEAVRDAFKGFPEESPAMTADYGKAADHDDTEGGSHD